ncbi:hypothetical protein RJ639_031432, partial [Escallonia herrerae]
PFVLDDMIWYIVMDLVHGLRTKRHNKVMNSLHLGGLNGLHAKTRLVIIRFPHSWVLKLIARAVFLAFAIVSFPWFSLKVGGFTPYFEGGALGADEFTLDPINVEMLPLLFRDLANEGLLKMGDRALFVSNGNQKEAIYNSQIATDNINMDLIKHSDPKQQGLVPDETYDFAFAHCFSAVEKFIDRALRVGGIVVVELNDKPTLAFQKPSNYKIIYLRSFGSTFVAMRKTISFSDTNSPTQRRLCGIPSEAKKAALKKLEDVLLEPPRAASGKSSRYLKRTRYLPDLTGDSLETYSRRVFIDVGLPEKNDAVAGNGGWFAKHYPTRNKDFEIYKIETVTEESSGREVAQVGMSDWLRKNLKGDEYVVMKAEAEVVEEMVKSKAIRLVDELFLECKHQGIKGQGERSRRAYWECLALYGSLRDEGVAVHQWWG